MQPEVLAKTVYKAISESQSSSKKFKTSSIGTLFKKSIKYLSVDLKNYDSNPR